MMVLTPTTTSWIGSPSALRRRFISIRMFSSLMASEVIESIRDENILIDMKRRRNALGEPIQDVVVGVSTIIQLGIKTAVPFLSKYRTVSLGSIEQQPFESQLTNAGDSRPDLEGQVCACFVRVSPFRSEEHTSELQS